MNVHSGVRLASTAFVALVLLTVAVLSRASESALTAEEAGLAEQSAAAFPVQVSFGGIKASYASTLRHIRENTSALAAHDSMVASARDAVAYMENATPALSGRKVPLLRWIEGKCDVQVGFMVADSVFSGGEDTQARATPSVPSSSALPTPAVALPYPADPDAEELPKFLRVPFAVGRYGIQLWWWYRMIEKQ